MNAIINENKLKNQLSDYIKEKYPGLSTIDYNVISCTIYDEYRTIIINNKLCKFAFNLYAMKDLELKKDYSTIYKKIINTIFDNVIDTDFVNIMLGFIDYKE